MSKIEGDERYKITNKSKGVAHKVDTEGKPDLDGQEYHIVSDLKDGYIVYIKPVDPSQPNPQYFIHKKYFI